MNKKWLIKVLSEDTDLSLKESELIIDLVFNNIVYAIENEGSFALPNFGTFKITERKAREGVNPRTGEKIQISASKSVSFKSSKKLKEKIN